MNDTFAFPGSVWRLALVSCMLVSPFGGRTAFAQAWRVQPSLQAQVTATDNGGLANAQSTGSDLLTEVSPRLWLLGRGGGYSLQGIVGFDALHYARQTQPNRLFPTGRLALEATLVERWLHLDASIGADQTAENPFLPFAEGNSGVNKITTLNYGLTPYLRHRFSPEVSLLARAGFELTKRRGEFIAGDPRRDSRSQRTEVILERTPLPLGGSLELEQEKTNFDGAAEASLESVSARAVVSYAPDPQVILGAVVGRERTRFEVTDSVEPIAGIRVRLLPTERTDMNARVERRFFGTGWEVDVRHRSPLLALQARMTREPVGRAGSQFLSVSDGSTATLLDAILTTRYPDANERAIVVRDLIDGLGLPSRLLSPAEVFSDAAQLRQGLGVSMAMLGRLSVVTASAYFQKADRLPGTADVLAPPGSVINAANRQRGLSIGINRRLGSLTYLNGGISASRTEGFGAFAGNESESRAVRLALNQRLSPRLTVHVGARRQLVEYLQPGLARFVDETAVFAGLNQRF